MQSLGILACGQVRADLVATHGEYPAMFARLLARVAPTLNTTAYRIYADEYPANPHAHDGYLITGSRFAVYDDEAWIRRLEDYVRELFVARKPTVGICFGHQMIARALGGVTAKAPQGWGIGKHLTQVLKTPAWMAPATPAYGVFVSHQDQVLELPAQAERLASNPHCPNSMFVIDDLFLGIQGHPEFTGEFARDLAAGRAHIYGEKTLAEAQLTYSEPPDSFLVAQWIVQFLSLAR